MDVDLSHGADSGKPDQRLGDVSRQTTNEANENGRYSLVGPYGWSLRLLMPLFGSQSELRLGRIRCHPAGLAYWGSPFGKAAWSELARVEIKAALGLLNRPRYRLSFHFKSGRAWSCTIRKGALGLAKLYRLHRLLEALGLSGRVAGNLLARCAEAFSVSFSEPGQDNGEGAIDRMRFYVYSLDFGAAQREYRHIAHDGEAVRLAMAMKQMRGDHRGAGRLLSKLLDLRGFDQGAELEYALTALRGGYGGAAIEVADRLIEAGIEGAAELAVAKADYLAGRRRLDEGLDALKVARAKVSGENIAIALSIDQLETHLRNQREYRGAAWRPLALKPALSKVGALLVAMGYCLFLARPALHKLPDAISESMALFALEDQGARASRVRVEPILYPAEDGFARLVFSFSAVEARDGVIPWIQGESIVPLEEGREILANPEQQVVVFDRWNVKRSEIGSIGIIRLFPIWSSLWSELGVPVFTMAVAVGFVTLRTCQQRKSPPCRA